MRPLTDRQREVLCAIDKLTAQHGYPPTYRELLVVLGIRSPHALVCHLRALKRKSAVTWQPYSPRTLRVVRREE